MGAQENWLMNLKAVVDREAGSGKKRVGIRAVATKLGRNEEYIYQLYFGKTKSGVARQVGKELARALSRAYAEGRAPDWVDQPPTPSATFVTHRTTPPPRVRESVAHDPILSTVKVNSPLPWESLVPTELPEIFDAALPDDAMASLFPAGSFVTFSTTEKLRPGDAVLLSDKLGHLYCRQYIERTPGHWIATPLNGAFLPLDSIADGLTVLAVMVGWQVRGRLSDTTST